MFRIYGYSSLKLCHCFRDNSWNSCLDLRSEGWTLMQDFEVEPISLAARAEGHLPHHTWEEHIHIPGRCFYDQLKKEKVPALIPRNAAWKILYVCLRWLFLFLECFFQTLDSILGIKSEFKVVAQKLHLHPLFNITATWQRVSFVRESNFLCTAEAQWTRVGLALTSAGTAQWESNCKIHHLTTTKKPNPELLNAVLQVLISPFFQHGVSFGGQTFTFIDL